MNLQVEPRFNDLCLIKEKLRNSMPVVVIKSHGHLGLGIARSLGRVGASIYAIGSDRRDPSLNSRYQKRKFIWDSDDKTFEETVEQLLRIGRSIGERSLLIPTTDEISLLLAEHADELQEWFVFHKLQTQLIRTLISKKDLYFLAVKNGIPAPRIFLPDSRETVKKYLKDLTFPVMLKGIDSFTAIRRTGHKMFIAQTKDELLRLYDHYENISNPIFMLQEYIPSNGGSWIFNGYFNDKSECLFSATGKKIRDVPIHIGATSFGVCLNNELIRDLSLHFMKDIGYKGIVDIDFAFDSRDRKYKILDVNPRLGSTFRMFTATNGLDVVRAEYFDLTNQFIPKSSVTEGRKWLVEDWDLITSLKRYVTGSLTLKKWLKSYCGVQETAWFAIDDLLPFFLMFKSVIQTTIRHR